jgi:hypothetical protein
MTGAALAGVRGEASMKALLLIPAAMIGLGISVTAAHAVPTARVAAKVEQDRVIVQVAEHECIRDEKGWHYMEKERRHDCRPKRPEGKEWGWRCEGKRCGWWHAKEKRWND